MYFVPQIQHDDCGFACLKMLLAKVHKDKNYLFLPQDEQHGPYSYQDLKDIAFKYGVSLNGLEAEDKTQIKKQQKFPIIASLDINGKMHAVIVYKVIFGRVYFYDPRLGKKDMSIKKFADIWDGTFLTIEEVNQQSCPYQEPKPITFSKMLILSILQFMVGLLAVLGVYFISEDIYIFVPVVLLSSSVIIELIVKAYSFHLMKKIDQFFYGSVEIKNGKYFATLQRFEKYKKSFLASPLNFILTLVTVLGLMLVTIRHDNKNFLLIAAPFLASMIEALFVQPYLHSGTVNLADKEKELDLCKDNDEFKDNVSSLHRDAYRFGSMQISIQLVGLALFVLTAIVLMALQEMVSFPYVVFYFCIELAIYRSFKSLLAYPDKMDELLKEKVEINNCLHQDENE